MKGSTILSVTFVLTIVLFSHDSHAQDYNRWSLPEGARMRLGKGNVLDVAWSADGTRLAVGGSVGIWVYDTRTGAEISLLTGHIYKVNAIAFSPDGLTLASGSRDDMVRLWDAATGQEKSTLTGHTYDVEAVAFSLDGTTLASGSRDGTVRLWDVETGQGKSTIIGDGSRDAPWVTSVAFSPDGSTLASGSYDGTILLWDVSPGAAPLTHAADFDGDGSVDFLDFLQFAAVFGRSWGDAEYDARFDPNGDGIVWYDDWTIFRQSYGRGT